MKLQYSIIHLLIYFQTSASQIAAQDRSFFGPYDSTYCNSLSELDSHNNVLTMDLIHQEGITLSNVNWHKLNIERISIIDCGLKFFPIEILRCESLQQILAGNNHLEELPEQICNLSELNTLNLHGNKLSDLPCSLAKLKKLKYLVLSSNNFSSIPEVLFRMEFLEVLDITGNDLTEKEVENLKLSLPNTTVYHNKKK